MNALELDRLQFGITTLFHFIFVPMSIGLAAWVALCQTMWYRTGKDVYLRMTRFWGKLMLISFAIGVVTGIVQEFQFGMNWSRYSRYVGDVFGAPLAMEGLAAFFLESTFIGLWIFGWGRLKPKVHLACAWLVSIGTLLSAFFILAANSWMQHPVGYAINHTTGRAEMKSIWAVLTNSTVLWAFPHTILAAATTAGMLILAVSAWNLLRGRHVEVFSRSARLILPITLAAGLWTTAKPASFSIFATGDFKRNPGHTSRDIRIPHALSILSTATWNGKVKGIDQIQREEQAKYGAGDYVPVVWVSYWSFRLMIGAGTLMILLALVGVFLARRGVLERKRWFHRAAIAGAVLPVVGNFSGWIFTEMARQPWVVFGLLRTNQANSPHVGVSSIVLTLVGFTLLYGVLAGVGGWLFVREVKAGPKDTPQPRVSDEPRPDLVLTY
jgi:cytochrome bd ubiquinol oxidase subunit I